MQVLIDQEHLLLRTDSSDSCFEQALLQHSFHRTHVIQQRLGKGFPLMLIQRVYILFTHRTSFPQVLIPSDEVVIHRVSFAR